MIQLIVAIIFFVSLCGVAAILFRKVPVLATLPPKGKSGLKKHRIIIDLEEKAKDISNAFRKQVFLHKTLSWIKCLVMKIEVRIDHLLHKIRQKNKPV